MTYYKLTNKNMQTYKGFQWKLNKWVKTDGSGELCSSGWIHCYNHPLLAVLLNPIHANIEQPRLFKINVSGKMKSDGGLKFGFTEVQLVKEISLPIISNIQKTAFAILCAKKVYKNKNWNKWADNWLTNKDRSIKTNCAAADAAVAAYAANYAAYDADSAADAAYAAAHAACAYAACAAYAANSAADAAVAANYAAYDADKIDLIKIAKEAMKY